MKISLQQNVAVLSVRRGTQLDLARLPETVKSAGFTPGEMRITAWGTFVNSPEGTRFKMADQELPVQGSIPAGSEPSRISGKVLYENNRLVLVPEFAR